MRLLTRLVIFLCLNLVHVLCFFGRENSLKGINNRSTHKCFKPPSVGVCHPLSDAWFYDAGANACKPFSRGICAGGNNLFPSLKKCTKTCIPLTKAMAKICLRAPVMGQCGPHVVSWFFDQPSQHCKMFNHTVCGGSGNRFQSELECQQVCRPKRIKARCSQMPMPGICFIGQKRFYFDVTKNTCAMFVNNKCGSNNNAFSSFRKCMERCSHNKAAIPCSTCSQKMNGPPLAGLPGTSMQLGYPGPHGHSGYPSVHSSRTHYQLPDTEGAPSAPSLPSRTNRRPQPAQVLSSFMPSTQTSRSRNIFPSAHSSAPFNTHRARRPNFSTETVSSRPRGRPITTDQHSKPERPFDLSDAL